MATMNSVMKLTDCIQVHINGLKFSKCALEDNLLSSSHRAAGQKMKPKSSVLISPEEVVSLPSAEDAFPPPPPEILSFSPLAGEIYPSFSVKPAVTFSEKDARQDNTGCFHVLDEDESVCCNLDSPSGPCRRLERYLEYWQEA
ncbi:hypothetical protein H671_4g11537 [Cricetulus griseus]|uniref:Uncharacterized protein n=1 Tax=Cricetulus griseus TaxID=10029 RepID=A0A061I8S4_CRIGR|nr:hypothetical protein H671_4g11537 [Cricetulus griseus]